MEIALQVVELGRDSRYLEAKRIWLSRGKSEVELDDDMQLQVNKVLRRAESVESALAEYVIDSTWLFGMSYKGVTTHYKTNDDCTVTVRIEGTLENLPIFEQCAVLNEIDLYNEWMPFCSKGFVVENLHHGDLVAHLDFKFTMFRRDALLHVFAADCLEENGKIVILGQSIDQWNGDNVGFSGGNFFSNRLHINHMTSVINIESPDTAKTTILANVDLKLPYINSSLINFVIRNVAGIILSLFQSQAKYVHQHPDCTHSHRIRENQEFYKDWVLKKLEKLCQDRGWQMPHIPSLNSDSALLS